MESVYHFEWTLPAAPADLWPYVSDTQRLNQALGLTPSYTEHREADGSHRREGAMRLYGLDIRWDEQLYDWVEGQSWSVERHYHNGLLRKLRFTTHLEPHGDRETRLQHSVFYEPRSVIWTVIARLELGGRLRRNLDGIYSRMARFLQGEVKTAWDLGAPQLADTTLEWLEGLENYLAIDGSDRTLVQRLLDSVREDDDRSLYRLRPYELAQQWGADRNDVLRLCLRAARRDLLAMHWDILCPHCRREKVRLKNLSELKAVAHCDACNVSIATDRERAVELVFSVDPRVRPITVNEYCVGGPANTPHILLQRNIPPGEELRVGLSLSPGTYRLRGPGVGRPALLTAMPDGTKNVEKKVRFTLEGETIDPPDASMLGAAGEITLVNADATGRALLVERADWYDDAVTVGRAMALQEFHDLFPKQAPSKQVRSSVEQVGIVVLNVVTGGALDGLDEDDASLIIGDLQRRVEGIVRKWNGAITSATATSFVATFSDLADAARAAAVMLAAVPAFGVDRRLEIRARVGFAAGKCEVAPGENGAVVYEGVPSEHAMAFASAALPDELRLTAALFAEDAVREALSQSGLEPTRQPPKDDTGQGIPTVALARPEPDPEDPAAEIDPDGLTRGEPIGSGATGAVYQATHPDGRRYALKVVESERPQAVDRYVREVAALRRLQDVPGIAAIRGKGYGNGKLSIVMEFIEGRTLRDRLVAEGTIALSEAAALAAKVARALQEAHRLGVLHRDVKPGNIILDRRGEPWLIDFGLAKIVRENMSGSGEDGTIAGTVFFLPPESFNHRVPLDGRADVYALGVTLYRMVTGTPPFEGVEVNEIIRKIIEEPPPKASERVPGLDASIDAVIAKALAKRPEDRYDTPAAFADDLDRLSAGARPLIAISMPPPPPRRKKRWWKP